MSRHLPFVARQRHHPRELLARYASQRRPCLRSRHAFLALAPQPLRVKCQQQRIGEGKLLGGAPVQDLAQLVQ